MENINCNVNTPAVPLKNIICNTTTTTPIDIVNRAISLRPIESNFQYIKLRQNSLVRN
mgnify:CR=1 FL=1